jgi:hypothetical protein
MSDGSSGEPEREQDPWPQPTDSAAPGAAAPQPEASAGPDSWSTAWAFPASPAAQPAPAGYAAAGPDSWSTAWADPASPAAPTAPAEPGSSAGAGQQLPPPVNGVSPAAADPWTAQPGALQPSGGQNLPPGGQHGYEQPAGQYPQAAGQYSQAAGQYGYQPVPGQYPAPAGQYAPQQWPAYPAAPRNNRVAIAALVCGLGQFVLGLLIVGNILLAIPAIICGAIGLKQTRQRGEPGRGLAIAGLVLGILGVVYFVIIVVVLIILGSIHHSG